VDFGSVGGGSSLNRGAKDGIEAALRPRVLGGRLRGALLWVAGDADMAVNVPGGDMDLGPVAAYGKTARTGTAQEGTSARRGAVCHRGGSPAAE
jgi:hypothetical protein